MNNLWPYLAMLNRIERKLDLLLELEQKESMDLNTLKAQVEKNTALEESAAQLIAGIGQQLKDALAANDPTAIQALADELTKSSADLAASITANTPAAPTGSAPATV